MRIAVFVNRFLPVSETFVLNQVTGLLERGHEVDIFASAPTDPQHTSEEALRSGLVRRVRFLAGPRPSFRRVVGAAWRLAWIGVRRPTVAAAGLAMAWRDRSWRSLGPLYAAAGVLRERRGHYDIVHCQFGPLGITALRLKQIGALRGKLVTSFRGYGATSYLKARPGAYRELFLEGDLFCPVNVSLKRRIMAEGCSEAKIAVHHSGIDCAKFAYVHRHRDPAEPTRILTVARLTEKKGIAHAIEAVSRLVRRGIHVAYTIVGDGPLRADLERLIEDLGLGKQVEMRGWTSHHVVTQLMVKAHVLVAPSVTARDGDQEGIPNVLKEAMATGMPIVSTWHGGIPELVDDGVSGFLVPERDVEALADRLAHLSQRPELWSAMGRAGRRKIEREFNLAKLNDDLVDLYARLLEDKPPNAAQYPGYA
jgi:colanic acid/amylovoran biosynthesis glycosyltransferase